MSFCSDQHKEAIITRWCPNGVAIRQGFTVFYLKCQCPDIVGPNVVLVTLLLKYESQAPPAETI